VSHFMPCVGHKVEATNKTLLRTLKKKLDRKKGAWVEFVPEVLWSYRTTTCTWTGETLFSLTLWDRGDDSSRCWLS